MYALSSAIQLNIGSTSASSAYLGSTKVWPDVEYSGWNPSEIPTMFWYDPSDATTITKSGSTVTQVTDKSGNGYTLSVTTAGKTGPTIGTRNLNGLNVFEYSSAIPNNQILENNLFTYTPPLSISLNIMMILRCDDEGSFQDQDFLFSGTESTANRIAVRRTGDDRIQIFNSLLSVATPLGSANEGVDLLVNSRINYSQSQIRINGTTLASGYLGPISFTSINIGGNENEDQAVEGYIAEIVAFTDYSKIEIIEGYLAWKWGLQGNLPVGHPYKNSAP